MRSRAEAAGGLESEKSEKSEATRLRILTAALELFRERGFEAATMRDIAVRAGVATGAAYYYFTSKDAIVLAFYRRAADEMAPQLEEVLSGSADLGKRLAGLLEVKLRYFEPSRRLLTALAAHVDPMNPLSPFSDQTQEIREQDIAVFERAITGARLRVPEDLKDSLPRIFWMYQMGLILYWIHDVSPSQEKTRALIEKSLRIIVRLLRLSSLPLMRPLRRQVLDLWDAVNG
jgi:AcrR family transcriptional regulator